MARCVTERDGTALPLTTVGHAPGCADGRAGVELGRIDAEDLGKGGVEQAFANQELDP